MNKVFVTGGCGFLGSHVCELFKEKGWGVIAYDNLTKFEYSRVPYFNIEKVREYNLKLLEGMGVIVIIDDIRNEKTLGKAARDCDFICHCAAQPAMTIAIENPQLDFDVNVKGYLNILECARKQNIPVVTCSTIHVYGNGINDILEHALGRFWLVRNKQTISEEDVPILTGKITPLHVSKRAMEIYTQAYIDTYGVKAANFRLTGIYGPRQFGGEDHGWVANFAIRTILGLPIKIFGTDGQVRDILYVKDAARAFFDWYKSGCPSGTYNIGGGKPCITSLKSCLDILKDLTGNDLKIEYLPKREGDLWYFCCDTTKAKRTFGWKPNVLPTEGIALLVDWIKDNKELFK